MGSTPAGNYESKMKDLIRKYKYLSYESRKERFTEFVQKETDIFIEIINQENINNISESDYNQILNKRTAYIKELFDYKDYCIIF